MAWVLPVRSVPQPCPPRRVNSLSVTRRPRSLPENAHLRRARVLPTSYRGRLLASLHLAKERADPKPSLDAVMTQAFTRTKVADYLRNSQTLEDYWQRPITAEQLQAEMDRMGQHTKQPEVLRELFEALGNDPFVIAECLARPALAQQLLAHPAFEQTQEEPVEWSLLRLIIAFLQYQV